MTPRRGRRHSSASNECSRSLEQAIPRQRRAVVLPQTSTAELTVRPRRLHVLHLRRDRRATRIPSKGVAARTQYVLVYSPNQGHRSQDHLGSRLGSRLLSAQDPRCPLEGIGSGTLRPKTFEAIMLNIYTRHRKETPDAWSRRGIFVCGARRPWARTRTTCMSIIVCHLRSSGLSLCHCHFLSFVYFR